MIRIAKALAEGRVGRGRGRPNQDELRRAISTAYYALFGALASAAADLFVGSSPSARRNPAWVHTYRSLQHGYAKNQCARILAGQNSQPPQSIPILDQRILAFAEAFMTLQESRLDADYNPSETYYRSLVQILIGSAEQALMGFMRPPRADRRAFVALVMHNRRG